MRFWGLDTGRSERLWDKNRFVVGRSRFRSWIKAQSVRRYSPDWFDTPIRYSGGGRPAHEICRSWLNLGYFHKGHVLCVRVQAVVGSDRGSVVGVGCLSQLFTSSLGLREEGATPPPISVGALLHQADRYWIFLSVRSRSTFLGLCTFWQTSKASRSPGSPPTTQNTTHLPSTTSITDSSQWKIVNPLLAGSTSQ